jgi:hypothetical protein
MMAILWQRNVFARPDRTSLSEGVLMIIMLPTPRLGRA